MPPLLDTSALVRYLTGDPPTTAEMARRILEETGPLLLTDVVIMETAYVLASNYRIPRGEIVEGLIELLQRQNIETFAVDKETVIEALKCCRPSGRVSFADALTWAAARASRANTVYSFDRRFPSHGMTLLREAPSTIAVRRGSGTTSAPPPRVC